MKNTIKIICLLLILIMCSCSTTDFSTDQTKSGQASSSTATIEPVNTLTPIATPPKTTETQASPNDTPQAEAAPINNEDVNAILAAGLPARAEMPPYLERYYYQYSYPERQDDNPNCVWFIGNTSVDLDGDGKNESINIIGGEEDSNGDFYDITVDIDGKQIKIESDSNTNNLNLGAQILDIDNKDGKKEVGISGYYWGEQSGYIITYDAKTPKVILKDRFEIDDLDITGNGTIQIWKDEFYRQLYKLKDDHSGFEKVDTSYYVTCCMYYYWQKYAPKSGFNLVTVGTTVKAEKLAANPGGKRDIPIAKDIEVYYGLLTKDGWLMVMDTDGNLLGWLQKDKALSLVPFYDNLAGDVPWLPYLS